MKSRNAIAANWRSEHAFIPTIMVAVGLGISSLSSTLVQRSAKMRGCLLSYSQAEPGRELTQPKPRLLAEPCILSPSFSPSVNARKGGDSFAGDNSDGRQGCLLQLHPCAYDEKLRVAKMNEEPSICPCPPMAWLAWVAIW